MKNKKIPSYYSLIISIISLIISTVVSLFTLVETNKTSRQLLEYQLEQERLPRIVALNYKLPVEIVNVNGNYIDFSCISNDLYPIKIPVYNVGVGFAQNCSIVWDKKSINDACANIVDLLSSTTAVHEYDQSELSNESGMYWASQDFIFSMLNQEYTTVRCCKYFSSDRLLGYDYEIAEFDLMCDDIHFPYVFPILNQSTPSYVEISDGLSILLLEIANQGISAPITFCFDINYQDLTGIEYSNSIEVEFLLNTQENTDKKFFEVSFEVKGAEC